MHIGIVGAGISGTYLACLLGRHGQKVTLFDPKAPWEKPCGGGLTSRTIETFPILNDFAGSGLPVKKFRMIAADGESVDVICPEPLLVVSRRSLSEYLLKQALSTDIDFVRKRVDRFVPEGDGWRLYTGSSAFKVDTLIGADGVNSLVRRRLAGPFSREDTTLSVGYWIDGELEEEEAVIGFLTGLNGYLWIFPRPGHLSVGIGAKRGEAGGKELYDRLHDFLEHHVPSVTGNPRTPYAAVIPSLLSSDGFSSYPLCGKNWVLTGDAAGWVDPLTGEGIYYAFRSAELLSQALEKKDLALYEASCIHEFVPELRQASSYGRRFFDPKVTTLLVSLSQNNKAVQDLLVRLMTGSQGYLSLKKEVFRILPGLGRDLFSASMKFRG